MNSKILLYLILLLPIAASAQEKSKWKGKISTGGSRYKGNVNKFDLRADVGISHADSTFEYSMDLKTIYGELKNVKNNEEYQGIIKFDYKPDSRFSPFVAAMFYRNTFNGYDQRLSGLVGAKATIFKNSTGDYSLSTALQYDAEKYTKIPEKDPKPNKELLRLSVRPKLKQKFGDNITLSNQTFFKPLLTNFDDIQIISTTSLTNKITKGLSISLKYEYTYDSVLPNPELNNDNGSLIVTINYAFD